MSGLFTDPGFWSAVILSVAGVLAIARLVLWQRSSEAPAPTWRLATLIGLQVVAAVLLWLTLNPPGSLIRSGALIVATASARAVIPAGPGDVLIALPEAGSVVGATRVPDLATALRRYPAPARIRILGQGLTPRDQIPLPAPVEFTAPPLPTGVIDLTLPDPAAPGASFVFGGRIGALPAGTVELADPADVVIDRARVRAGERFVLTGAARTPGLALFELRLRDAGGTLIEAMAIPVEVRAQTPPRVLVLAGAPGAETKYLKRWAEDSAIALTVDIEVGGGVRLGDAPMPLTAATLNRLDIVVIDDRRWEALAPGQRAALAGAIDGGLGILLRPSGPLSAATRRDWAGLGISLTGSGDPTPLRLDPPRSPTPTPDASAVTEDSAEALPQLGRQDLADTGQGAVTLLRDADGAALASWRTRGRGRVGVWTVTDSYALVLTGRPDRYGDMWSGLFSEIGRAGDDSRAEVIGIARAGARVAVCRLVGPAAVLDPAARRHDLRPDPVTGDRACAAFWPEQPGWHVIHDGEDRQTPFYVQPSHAGPSLLAAATQSATVAIASDPWSNVTSAPTSRASGPAWPWFLALLASLAALWSLERNPKLAQLSDVMRSGRLFRRRRAIDS